MPERHLIETLVAPESLAALDADPPAKLAVGIHVLNRARSVTQELDAVAAGLEGHFRQRRTVVLVMDAGSHDGTADAVRAWSAVNHAGPARRCLERAGAASPGRAILALLSAARRLGVQACALVDGALTGFGPDWVEALLGPVAHDDADYVSPAYSRTLSEGTLTTNLLAPLTGALYGRRLQQLVGGCAGLSGAFVDRCLQAGVPPADWLAHGAEIWLTTEALASGSRVIEAHLGRRPVDPGTAAPDVPTTLVRTVGPLFALMEHYALVWHNVRGSTAPPRRGEMPAMLADTGRVNAERMVRAFKLGLKDLLPVWEQIMPEATLGQLYPLGLLAPEEFRLPPALWARVVSDFAIAYHEHRMPHDHLVRALTPLYLGRVAAFLLEARAGPPARLPDVPEHIVRAFEAEKESLVARWR